MCKSDLVMQVVLIRSLYSSFPHYHFPSPAHVLVDISMEWKKENCSVFYNFVNLSRPVWERKGYWRPNVPLWQLWTIQVSRSCCFPSFSFLTAMITARTCSCLRAGEFTINCEEANQSKLSPVARAISMEEP